MMTIYGKYTNAIVYADILDDKTKEQIKVLVDQGSHHGGLPCWSWMCNRNYNRN